MEAAADRDGLAMQVVDLAKATVLADNHFLAAAIGRLKTMPMLIATPFATDGYFLAFGTNQLLRAFVANPQPPTHDLLHSIAHCLFLHPYVDATVDRKLWNLACDLAAERVVAEFLGPRPGARGAELALAVEQIERDMNGRADAERMYRHLREGRWASSVDAWEELARSDSHELWCSPSGTSGDGEGSGAADGTEARGGIGRMDGPSESVDRSLSGEHAGDGNNTGNGDANADDNDSDSEGNESPSNARKKQNPRCENDKPLDRVSEGSRGHSGAGATAGLGSGAAGTTGASASGPASSGTGAASGTNRARERERQRSEWQAVATSLAVQLQTLSSRRGGQLPGFLDDLIAVNRQHVDYAAFLRSFATRGEVLRLSDDEFDQVFYTYGLQLYGNLPLIEPLEYREERRVREFVIVIDTSGSVRGDAIRAFVGATFDILKSTEAFFRHVHVRILQCDVRVHADDTVKNPEDLARWGDELRVRGGGGTDFRPAFDYVDALIEEGAFHELGGLVYFTDGWGTYPDRTPAYKTAFAFYDENHRPEIVPPWAVQIVLDDYAIGNGAPLGQTSTTFAPPRSETLC